MKTSKSKNMKEQISLWQRCEALGPIDDQGIQLEKDSNESWCMYLNFNLVFEARMDSTYEAPLFWLAEPILQHFEELAKQCAHDASDFPPPTELGENEDLTITFPADEPTGFVKEVSKPLGLYMARENGGKEVVRIPALSAEELLNLNENPIILYDETFLYPGDSPKPKDSWEVEKAVVGYEPPTPIELPKPIDTIEKKHELRIKNLEAQVKDMAGEMENLIIQVRALNRQVFSTHLD